MRIPRRMRLLVATHGAAILLGLGLMLWAETSFPGGGSGPDMTDQRMPGRPASAMDGPKNRDLDGRGRVERLAARDYQDAWEAIGHRKQTVAERKEQQMAVLRQWSLVDLPAALRAVMGDGHWLDFDDERVSAQELAEAFSEAFRRDPCGALDLLESSPEIALGSESVFHNLWVKLPASDPEVFLEMLGHRPAEMLEGPVTETLNSPKLNDPARRHAFLRELASRLPGEKGVEMVMKAVEGNPPTETPEVLLERLQAAEGPERTVAVADYVFRIRQEPGMLKENWTKLPPEIRASTIDRFFMRSLDAYWVLPVLDIAMAEQRMPLVRSQEAIGAVETFLNRDDTFLSEESQKLADWAMALPATEDTQGVFRAAVRARLAENKDGAREWVKTMPAGWHRDLALGELKQQEAE